MTKYVMFGFSGRFGDYIDLVHEIGGTVSKIVVNVPDPSEPGEPTFDERVATYRAQRAGWGIEEELVIETLRDFSPSGPEKYFFGFAGIGQLAMRDHLVECWGLEFLPLVHPTAVISPTASIGGGAVVNAGAVVASQARVGECCRIGRGATVGHDERLDECVQIEPGANLASGIHAKRGARVGIGANVLEDLVLGEESYVAGGALVRSDVPDHAMVAGVPAVLKKQMPAREWPAVPPGVK